MLDAAKEVLGKAWVRVGGEKACPGLSSERDGDVLEQGVNGWLRPWPLGFQPEQIVNVLIFAVPDVAEGCVQR